MVKTTDYNSFWACYSFENKVYANKLKINEYTKNLRVENSFESKKLISSWANSLSSVFKKIASSCEEHAAPIFILLPEKDYFNVSINLSNSNNKPLEYRILKYLNKYFKINTADIKWHTSIIKKEKNSTIYRVVTLKKTLLTNIQNLCKINKCFQKRKIICIPSFAAEIAYFQNLSKENDADPIALFNSVGSHARFTFGTKELAHTKDLPLNVSAKKEGSNVGEELKDIFLKEFDYTQNYAKDFLNLNQPIKSIFLCGDTCFLDPYIEQINTEDIKLQSINHCEIVENAHNVHKGIQLLFFGLYLFLNKSNTNIPSWAIGVDLKKTKLRSIVKSSLVFAFLALSASWLVSNKTNLKKMQKILDENNKKIEILSKNIVNRQTALEEAKLARVNYLWVDLIELIQNSFKFFDHDIWLDRFFILKENELRSMSWSPNRDRESSYENPIKELKFNNLDFVRQNGLIKGDFNGRFVVLEGCAIVPDSLGSKEVKERLIYALQLFLERSNHKLKVMNVNKPKRKTPRKHEVEFACSIMLDPDSYL